MPSAWNLHYERWVINDCESDRSVGESFESPAVEFLAESGLESATGSNETAAAPVGDFRYRVTALVVFVSEKAAVIDFGLNAVGPRAHLPSDCRDGEYVVGDIRLSLTPFIEILPKEVLQGLTCSWHVDGISADLTPYIPHPEDPTGRFQIRDISQIRYESVSSTNLIITHSYVLHCSKTVAAGTGK